jgi:hypothetical protein
LFVGCGREYTHQVSNPLFTPETLRHDGGFFRVWRKGLVVGVDIRGELNDERNPVWRAWLDAHFVEQGMPRFIALDVHEAIPAATLPKRMQTAAWSRTTLSRIEQGSLFLGDAARVSLTVGAILRIAGMTNVHLRTTRAQFDDDAASYVQGTRTVK